ncbi:hypothetical protein DNTS_021267 [Danionella cerebrum]|uniref:Link domain-containing protein n=1 Tax=Danionella cerebrum TaxID=2873325 RepID=A0A553R0V6_9TELE|nr:hypothetical protein DNTS_021267 [Danionella translucida]
MFESSPSFITECVSSPSFITDSFHDETLPGEEMPVDLLFPPRTVLGHTRITQREQSRMKMMKMVFLCSLVMSCVTLDMRMVKVFPKQAISGVFEVSLGNKYALNASAARDVCQKLGLTIANKAQITVAQKSGLETCRFGWIDEQVAVVPRVHVKSNCGNGSTGVVVWRANPSAQFEVFCFNVTAVPAALLITVTFAVMLAVFVGLYYFKTKPHCRAHSDPEQQMDHIETELWENCSEKEQQEMEEWKTHKEHKQEQKSHEEEYEEQKVRQKPKEKEQMEEGNQEFNSSPSDHD